MSAGQSIWNPFFCAIARTSCQAAVFCALETGTRADDEDSSAVPGAAALVNPPNRFAKQGQTKNGVCGFGSTGTAVCGLSKSSAYARLWTSVLASRGVR